MKEVKFSFFIGDHLILLALLYLNFPQAPFLPPQAYIGRILLSKKRTCFWGFGSFTYRALIKSGMSKKKAVVWAILTSTFYGMTDEYHQLSQARSPGSRCWFDGIGSVLSVLLFITLFPNFRLPFLK